MFTDLLAQVRRVPRGEVATYGDIAYAAGYPGSARQVAWALHTSSNGLPWHRIVGSDGKILLPAERGFEQRMRLRAEGVEFVGLRVNMKTHRHSFFGSKKPLLRKKAAHKDQSSRSQKKSRPTKASGRRKPSR
jgi:methylated-DNA-protein-cysteine methyltransferase-like protein